MSQSELAERFLTMHHQDGPLLMPNPWDEGSAKLLAFLGFKALATTSSGSAMARGRPDGSMTSDDAIAHAASIVSSTELPVSADLENGFARDPQAAAGTYRRCRVAGLAGASIEDYDPETREIYDIGLASERVAAAAEALHSGGARLVLTARAENFFRGHKDLADTITRLQAYQEAGADVVFAPLVTDLKDIRSVVESVDVPVNVIARPNGPSIAQLASVGVARVSVGGSFAFAALGGAVNAARELLDEGTYSLDEKMLANMQTVRKALG
jgi:2-methylisocitrate lyase-like PEP mutase family enzyme